MGLFDHTLVPADGVGFYRSERHTLFIRRFR